MSDLKYTIMNMLKTQFDILVTDAPINNGKKKDDFMLPSLLFKKYYDDTHTRIQVIDYDKYVNYRKEEIQTFDNFNVYRYYLTKEDGTSVFIKEYDTNIGAMETFEPIENLLEYNDKLYVLKSSEQVDEKEKDFIYVYSAYNYANTMNKNTVAYYNRINIDIFLYDDEDNHKVDYYCDIIHKLFERDFNIYDDDGKKIDTAYIQTQLSFNMSEYNISNKILRGSMLIRTYK